MELLKELGISGGTAIILLIVSYWAIKGAVKNGIIAAFEEITGKDTLKKLLKAKYMNGEAVDKEIDDGNDDFTISDK